MKTIYLGWMPYLKIVDKNRTQQPITIGKARFLPDNDTVWQREVGRPRPEFLKIFREFPRPSTNSPGDPIYGTLVLSDDKGWLEQYFDEAVAVVYFVGQKKGRLHAAENFIYHEFLLKTDSVKNSDAVLYNTKHSRLIETADSIAIHPPLVVRGNQPHEIDIEKYEHEKLVKLIGENPKDRIVIAVRQYFRSHFSDKFTSPFRQDYANFCAVIEAVLDQNTMSGASDKFVSELVRIYGGEEEVRTFFHGLYVARSLYVHGATVQTSLEGETKNDKAYRYFVSRHGTYSVLSELCRDIICKKIRSDAKEYFSFDMYDSAKPLLWKLFYSDRIWKQAASVLTQHMAVSKITAMTDDEFSIIEKLATEFVYIFDWSCVTTAVNTKKLCKAINACASVVGQLDRQAGDYGIITLMDAARAQDCKTIKTWSYNHYHGLARSCTIYKGRAYLDYDGRAEVMKQIMVRLAKYTENIKD